jgi:hypothetical protein
VESYIGQLGIEGTFKWVKKCKTKGGRDRKDRTEGMLSF